MSKIICDVCGSSYPESATQCPICGCVRPPDMVATQADAGEHHPPRSENYTYVKGGRFSKANVKKRNQQMLRDDAKPEESLNKPSRPVTNKSDRGLVIAVCVLLLAIIAVVIYIAVRFFAPLSDNRPQDTDAPAIEQTSTATEDSTLLEIPCAEITLSQSEVTLSSVNAAHLLNVALNPDDTTDTLTFTSADETIATVTQDGKIVAVGAGETVVTVTCGEASAQCKVVCSIEQEPTEEVTQPTVPVDVYAAPYKLNKTDVTIRVDETFVLKLMDANKKTVAVSFTADDPAVCTVDGNSITGAAVGTTKVSVTYEGEIFFCIVRVV